MVETNLLDEMLDLTGSAYIETDDNLLIRQASQTIQLFSKFDGNNLSGHSLGHVFPQLENSLGKIRKLTSTIGEQSILRIQPKPTQFVKVTARSRMSADGHVNVLLILEDISILVFRTEILNRRIQALDTRCLELEEHLLEAGDAGLEIGKIYEYHTGVYTLDYMMNRLEEEEKSSRQIKKALSIIVLQYQNKQTNAENANEGNTETWAELKGLPQLLRQAIRSTDILGSRGIKGFMILLPQTTSLGAEITLARIRSNIAGSFNAATKVNLGVSELDLDDEDDSTQAMYQRAEMAAMQDTPTED